MAIVASASAIYERDLCLQLQLSNIYTPDDNCGGESNTFKNFSRNFLCRGSAYMLDDFARWMTGKRDSASIDSDALVHLFTGSKPSDAIGCAWTGVVSFRLCACRRVKLCFDLSFSFSSYCLSTHDDIGSSAGPDTHSAWITCPSARTLWRKESYQHMRLGTIWEHDIFLIAEKNSTISWSPD